MTNIKCIICGGHGNEIPCKDFHFKRGYVQGRKDERNRLKQEIEKIAIMNEKDMKKIDYPNFVINSKDFNRLFGSDEK